jgi:hypothetical protein
MGGHVQRREFASSEEVRNILHLYEWHGRLLELDARRGYNEVDKSGAFS